MIIFASFCFCGLYLAMARIQDRLRGCGVVVASGRIMFWKFWSVLCSGARWYLWRICRTSQESISGGASWWVWCVVVVVVFGVVVLFACLLVVWCGMVVVIVLFE